MKTLKLTQKQIDRKSDIADRLWEIRREENKLHEELKAMGLTYDLMGKCEQKIEVKE